MPWVKDLYFWDHQPRLFTQRSGSLESSCLAFASALSLTQTPSDNPLPRLTSAMPASKKCTAHSQSREGVGSLRLLKLNVKIGNKIIEYFLVHLLLPGHTFHLPSVLAPQFTSLTFYIVQRKKTFPGKLRQ